MILTEQTLIQYYEYIRNPGQSALACAAFDDDWDPVGPALRQELAKAGYITETEGKIALTQRGQALVERQEQ